MLAELVLAVVDELQERLQPTDPWTVPDGLGDRARAPFRMTIQALLRGCRKTVLGLYPNRAVAVFT